MAAPRGNVQAVEPPADVELAPSLRAAARLVRGIALLELLVPLIATIVLIPSSLVFLFPEKRPGSSS